MHVNIYIHLYLYIHVCIYIYVYTYRSIYVSELSFIPLTDFRTYVRAHMIHMYCIHLHYCMNNAPMYYLFLPAKSLTHERSLPWSKSPELQCLILRHMIYIYIHICTYTCIYIYIYMYTQPPPPRTNSHTHTHTNSALRP